MHYNIENTRDVSGGRQLNLCGGGIDFWAGVNYRPVPNVLLKYIFSVYWQKILRDNEYV